MWHWSRASAGLNCRAQGCVARAPDSCAFRASSSQATHLEGLVVLLLRCHGVYVLEEGCVGGGAVVLNTVFEGRVERQRLGGRKIRGRGPRRSGKGPGASGRAQSDSSHCTRTTGRAAQATQYGPIPSCSRVKAPHAQPLVSQSLPSLPAANRGGIVGTRLVASTCSCKEIPICSSKQTTEHSTLPLLVRNQPTRIMAGTISRVSSTDDRPATRSKRCCQQPVMTAYLSSI